MAKKAKLKDVKFTPEILEKYKEDTSKITKMCKKIDKNKKIQAEYETFLEDKKRRQNMILSLSYLGVLLLLLLIGFATFKCCTYFVKRDCKNSGGTYINNKCIYEQKTVVE